MYVCSTAFSYACELYFSCSSALLALNQAGNKAVGVMKAGQTFTIEPMINAGTSAILKFINL